MKKNPIPGEYPSWNTFMALRDLNLDRLKLILEELSQASAVDSSEASTNNSKLANFYNSFMNEDEISAIGIAPLLPIFDLAKNSARNPTVAIAELHAR